MIDERAKYSLRTTQEMLDQLRVIAESHHRSVNSEIIVVLENYIKENQDILDKLKSQENWLRARIYLLIQATLRIQFHICEVLFFLLLVIPISPSHCSFPKWIVNVFVRYRLLLL